MSPAQRSAIFDPPVDQVMIWAGTVSAPAMLRKLAGFPRQNPVARALCEIGRIERTLFMLDWFDDPERRRRTVSILDKGEARNALARAIFFNRLEELRDRTFEKQRRRGLAPEKWRVPLR